MTHLWTREKTEPADALSQAQIWMRDSTNREKLEYFKEIDKTGNPKITREALKRIYKAIGFSEPGARDFAHPYYWAGFQYAGA
ncbi:MAG: CHAT domain-containing protein [Desulfobacteraceae bacterium]|nr:CHAT domain-containing protein [Desulfobacteraceae bacterium]